MRAVKSSSEKVKFCLLRARFNKKGKYMNTNNKISQYFASMKRLSVEQALIDELKTEPGLQLLQEVQQQLGRYYTDCCENMNQRRSDLELASKIFVDNGVDLNRVVIAMNSRKAGCFSINNGVLVCGGCYDTYTLFEEAGKSK